MKLYHISRHLKFDGAFVPRIPDLNDGSTENCVTPRICTTKTVEGCLSAIPEAYILDEVCSEQRGMFRVYVFDTEKHQIQPEHLVLPEELDRLNEVPDAYLTEEVWITCPVTLDEEDSYLIIVQNFEQKQYRCVPYSVRELAKTEGYNGDLDRAYFELFPEETYVPEMGVVERVDVVTSKDDFPLRTKLYVGDLYALDFSNSFVEKELSQMQTWIREYPEWGIECLNVDGDDGKIELLFQHSKGFETFCQQWFSFIEKWRY